MLDRLVERERAERAERELASMSSTADRALAEWQACKRERDEAQAEIERLRALLRLVVLDCANLHHAAKDRHIWGDPCPVEQRIRAALAEGK